MFLDMAQAFEKILQAGMSYTQTEERATKTADIKIFKNKQEDAYSELIQIKTGVPQRNKLGPVLLNMLLIFLNQSTILLGALLMIQPNSYSV